MPKSSFTAILEREGDLYVALCPELDVASQGPTVEEATANLKEAVELFLECADPAEVREGPAPFFYHGAMVYHLDVDSGYTQRMALPPSLPPPSFSTPPPYVNVAEYLRYATPEIHWREIPSSPRKARPLTEIVLDLSDEGREEWAAIVEAWSKEAADHFNALADLVQEKGARNIDELIDAIDEAARNNENAVVTIGASIQKLKEIAAEMHNQARSTKLSGYPERFIEQAEKAERQARLMEGQRLSYAPVMAAFHRLMPILRTVRDASVVEMTENATSELLALVWGSDADDL